MPGIHSLWLCLNLFCLLRGKSRGLTHEAPLISWIHLKLPQIWNMALGQISCSERETHAMDSNLTHSPCTSFFSCSELLTLVLLFCGYKQSQTLDYSQRFAWRKASCLDAEWTVIGLPGSSSSCVLFNHVHLYKWRRTSERKRWLRNKNN